jgi:hypothetical protein
MAKKLLIVSFLILLGLTTNGVKILAQASNQSQITEPVPLIIDYSTVPEVNFRLGVKNNQIKKIYEIFKALGYLPSNVSISDYYGSNLKEAIKKFQKENGLPATGIFGPATRKALRKILKEGPIVIDKTVNLDCMKQVVEKRENAILSAYENYSQKIKNAHETRKTDLLAAWSIQDPIKRHKAIKLAWDKYRQNLKTVRIEWTQNRKTIWEQFIQDAKSCKATAVEIPDLEIIEVKEE